MPMVLASSLYVCLAGCLAGWLDTSRVACLLFRFFATFPTASLPAVLLHLRQQLSVVLWDFQILIVGSQDSCGNCCLALAGHDAL